jgi:alkylhydroperoxidase/carboxymuconolactone decarboxylase family protein YurZ
VRRWVPRVRTRIGDQPVPAGPSVRRIFERGNLDWQSRELATVGALAATPGVEVQLRSHMAASMRVGLSAPQLREGAELLNEQGDTEAVSRAHTALANQAK